MDYQNIRLEMSGADARLILLGDKLPAQQAAISGRAQGDGGRRLRFSAGIAA